jgi:hypothetical protein
VRAAKEGTSLSELLLREVTKIAERPTLQEIIERVKRRGSVSLDPDSATIIRDLRGPLR